MKKILITLAILISSTLAIYSQCPAYFTYISDSSGVTSFTGFSGDSTTIYTWNFGDGTSATGQFVTHNFNNGSWNYVCLNIVSSGIQCTYCDTIVVNDTTITNPCNTYFSFTENVQVQGEIAFTGYSDDSLSTYSWDFGDSSTSTIQNPVHNFSGPAGSFYYVCLNTVNSFGYQCTYCDYVTVGFDSTNYDSCNTFFTSVGDNQGNVTFAGYSNDSLSTYYWDFGDGASSTNQNPTHFFGNYPNGTYYVCLNTVSSTQYQCTYCDYVIINDSTTNPCNTYFVSASDSMGNTTYFYAFSNDTLTTYYWDFGDGTSATGQNVTHQFGNGTYYVCLNTVSNGIQCTYCDYVSFGNGTNCNLYIISASITNESGIGTNDGAIDIDVIGGTTPYTFIWNNGATTQNISGLQQGNYNVYVTDNNQCFSWATFEVYNDYNNPIFDDSLVTSPLDTCFNFIPDSAYIYSYTYDGNNNTVSAIWIVFDASGTQTGFVTVNYLCDSTGYYVAFLTLECSKGTYTFSDQMHVVEQAVGINATENSDANMSLYPNPVSDNLYISMSFIKAAPVTVNIMNLTGQIIYTEKTNPERGQNVISINTSSLTSGLYFVHINYDGQNISRKFVK